MSVIYIDSYRLGVSGPSDPYFSNVALLLHGDGTNGSTTIIDSSPSSKTVTAFGDAQISTAQSKFGSAIAFDAVGDRLTASSADFAFGTGDFTIETWLYVITIGVERGFMQTSDVAGGLKPSYLTGVTLYFAGSNTIVARIGGATITSTTSAFSLNTWFHFALTRNNGSVKIFVNGVERASGSSSDNCIGQNIVVGGYYDASYLYNGYIDDFRITKGVARYTSNFTPPTAPFPNS